MASTSFICSLLSPTRSRFGRPMVLGQQRHVHASMRRTHSWPRHAVIRHGLEPLDTGHIAPTTQHTRRGTFTLSADSSVTAAWSAPGHHAVCCHYAMRIAHDSASVTVDIVTCDTHVPQMGPDFPPWAIHVYRTALAWVRRGHGHTPIAQWLVSTIPRTVCTIYSAPRGSYPPYELNVRHAHNDSFIRVRIDREARRASVHSIGGRARWAAIELPLELESGQVHIDWGARLMPNEGQAVSQAAQLAPVTDAMTAATGNVPD